MRLVKLFGTGGVFGSLTGAFGILRNREPPSDFIVCSHSTFAALNTFNRFVTPPDR